MRHYVLTIFMIMLRLCSDCSSRPASPFVLFLSPPLAGCSFSRLNAAVKPFSVSVGLFYVAQFTWSRPRLARRRVGASIDSIDNSSKSSHNAAAGHQNGNEHGISFNFLYVCYKGECHYVCVCVCVVIVCVDYASQQGVACPKC